MNVKSVIRFRVSSRRAASREDMTCAEITRVDPGREEITLDVGECKDAATWDPEHGWVFDSDPPDDFARMVLGIDFCRPITARQFRAAYEAVMSAMDRAEADWDELHEPSDSTRAAEAHAEYGIERDIEARIAREREESDGAD